MNKIIVSKGWFSGWESVSEFTLTFETTTEEDRKAVLDLMNNRKTVKVTIEEVKE